MIVTAIYDYLIYYRLRLAADTAVAHFRTILLRIFFNQIRTNVRKCDGLHTPAALFEPCKGRTIGYLGGAMVFVSQQQFFFILATKHAFFFIVS